MEIQKLEVQETEVMSRVRQVMRHQVDSVTQVDIQACLIHTGIWVLYTGIGNNRK